MKHVRFLSLGFTLLLCLLVAAPVYAEQKAVTPVAMVNDTPYQNFSDAVEMWKQSSDATLTLLTDYTFDGVIEVSGTNLTLNLNGHSIKNKTSYVEIIRNTGSLTITGTGTFENQKSNHGVNNAGTLVITGIPTFEVAGKTFQYYGGTMDLSGLSANTVDGWTIYFGKAVSDLSVIKLPEYCQLQDSNGGTPSEFSVRKTATIKSLAPHEHTKITYTSNNNGLTHLKEYDCCPDVAGAEEYCSGGAATCKSKAICQYCETEYGAEDTTNHVNEAFIYTPDDSSTHTKKYDCCNTIASAKENHTFDSSGTCICTRAAASSITDASGNLTYYGNLSDALNNWQDGTTLTLLDNFTLETSIVINQLDVVLNLNGFSLTGPNGTGDIINNQGSLTINGPGTIKGYHGISNTTNNALMLNDVTIVAEGYGVQNYGVTTITGNAVIDAQTAAINFAQGELDLSGLSGEVINGWQVFSGNALTDLNVITLPDDYSLCVDGAPVTSLAKGEKAIIQIPTAPVMFDITVVVTPSAGGTASVDMVSAEAGETVTLSFNPNDGFVLNNIVVADAANNSISVNDYTFIMPSSNVTVSVTFIRCDHTNTEPSYQLGATDSTKHDATYSCCGTVITEGHSGGTATCLEPATCRYCNTEYGTKNASNHVNSTYIYTSVGDGSHTAVYSCCKTTALIENCSGGTATCQVKAICKHCNTEYGNLNSINHVSNTYIYTTNDGSTHTKKHDCCDMVASAKENHNFGQNGTCICNQKAAASITNASGNVDYYGNLSDTLSNWPDNTTLTLLDSFSLESCIEVSSYGVVLNLNSFSLTGPKGTGDVISNQGSLIINGPGTIKGYHGISNAANKSLMLNDVTIVADGYGVQNYGVTTITGDAVIKAQTAAINFAQGELDLSGLSGEVINGWQVFAGQALTDLNVIKLPDDYHLCVDGAPVTSLGKGEKATIQIPTAPVMFDITVVVTPSEGGSASADKTTAEAGETVTLSFNPNDGFVLNNIVVADAANNAISVNDYTFIMPSSDVTVSVTFSRCDHSNIEPSYQLNATDSTKHDATYSCCGTVITEGHSGGIATCLEQARCQYCNTKYGELNITYHTSATYNYSSNGDGSHTAVYSCCKTTALIEPCFGGIATCQEKAVCPSCNTEYGNLNSTNHVSNTYICTTNDSNTHAKKHDCCGMVAVTNESHNFDNNGTCICNQAAIASITDNSGNLTYYGNLSSALSNWPDNTTLTLLDNFTLETSIVINQLDVVLNLNGFSLTGPEGTGDVINNQGALTITGPGTITGYHGISNTANKSLTLNDVTIVAEGYGVQNFGAMTITENAVIEAQTAAINFAQGELDLSGLSGETINGWQVFAGKALTGPNVIKLPADYLLCVDGAPVTSLGKGEKATIQIPTAPVMFDITVVVTPSEGGAATADKTTAETGETVTLSFTPNDGYLLGNIIVTDTASNVIPVHNNTFSMPSSDVTVSVMFIRCDHTNIEPSYCVNKTDGTQHDATYSCCGTVITEGHSGGIANCLEQATCRYCNTEYGTKNASIHVNTTYLYTSDGDGSHTAVYSCCKTTALIEPCFGGIATCQEKAVCPSCNTEYGNLSSTNHVSNTYIYSTNDSSSHTKKYDCCNIVASAKENHYFDSSGTCICTQAAASSITNASGNLTYYGNLSDALSNWPDNTTLTLLDNFSLESCIEVSSYGVVLNLNSFSLTGPKGTGDVINNQGALTITGPGTITGYHGISNTTNNSLMLNDVTIIAEGYGVQNYGVTTITGNAVIEAQTAAINFAQGVLDLSGLSGEVINGWQVFASKVLADLNVIKLPDDYLLCVDGAPVPSLAKGEKATIQIPTTPVMFDVMVVVIPSEGGSASADKTTAETGETVTLSFTPNDGYLLGNIIVTDTASNVIPVHNNTFSMPSSNVTVSVTFSRCDHTNTEPSYHLNATDSTMHDATYSCCGKIITEGHSGGIANCLEPATCRYCNTKYGELNITYHTSATYNYISNGDGSHTAVYSCCKTTALIENCSGGTATCQIKAICQHCNTEYGNLSSTTHVSNTYIYTTNNSSSHTKKYDCCNVVVSAQENHNFSRIGLCICNQVATASITDNSGNLTYYGNLSSALSNWQDRTTLTLLDNFSLESCIEVSSYGVVLNLNSFSLTGPKGTDDVISNQGSLTITGPGTITGYHGISNTTNNSLTLNDVTIIAEGYGVQNFGATTITGNAVINAQTAAINFAQGELDLSGLSGEVINGWQVFAGQALTDLNVIKLPADFLLCVDGAPVTSLAKGEKASIQIPTAPVMFDVTVVVTPSEGGTTSVDMVSAEAGETVTLSFMPNNGYLLGNIIVTDTASNVMPVHNNAFSMPSSNVTVTVTFIRCDHSNIEPSYHLNATDSTKHDATYSCCGTVITEGHSGGIANCLEPATCRYCNTEYGTKNASNHVNTTYIYTSDGDGSHTAAYSCCKTTALIENCSGGTATCQRKAVCQHCNTEYGKLSPTNHVSNTYIYTTNDGSTHTKKHDCCNVVVSAQENHNFSKIGLCICNQAATASLTNASGNVTYYGNLSDALSNWQDGTTLTLLDNFTLESCIEVSSYGVVLNLNSFSLTGPKGTGDVISNQGSLIINGPGSITGYHGMSNAATKSLMLNDVTIIAEGYGVQNYGATTITGNAVIEAQTAAIYFAQGALDLSGLSGETIDGWQVFAGNALTDLNVIILPDDYLLCVDGAPVTSLAKGEKATIQIPTAPVMFGVTVVVTPSEGGTASVDMVSAEAGETVTLSFMPNNGYLLGDIIVTDAANNSIPVNDYTFIMPSSNVTVSVMFIRCDHTNTEPSYQLNVTDSTKHDAKYSCCGTVITAGHSGGIANCLEPATCRYCNTEYGTKNASNHVNTTYIYTSDGDGSHTAVYSCCKTTALIENCSGGTATCQVKAICQHCNTEYGNLNSINHVSNTYIYTTNNSSSHTKKYNCCDMVASAKENHSFGQNGTCICNQKAAARLTNASGSVDYYGNLSDALSNWQDSTTLTLLDNFTLESCIEVSSYGVVLNLNSFSLTGPKGTGDVISNQSSLTINGPGTITGYHGISNTANTSLMLNDVTIVAEGYGVQNFGATTITENAVIDAQTTAIYFAQGELDLSGLSGETIDGWQVFAGKPLADLNVITLPDDYHLCVDGAPVTSLGKGEKATFQIPTAPIMFDVTVVVTPSEGGAASVDMVSAEVGETVTLSFNPNDGFVLNNIVVADAANNSIPVNDYTFIMPSSNVTVTVTFIRCDHSNIEPSYQLNATDSTKHDATYSCCGKVITEGHSGGIATCQIKSTCKYCKVEYGEKDTSNHTSEIFTYTSNGDGSHTAVYSCCKTTALIENCSGGTATCQVKAVCQYCNTEYGNLNSINHVSNTYIYTTNDSSSHTKKYDCCNIVASAKENHNFDSSGTCICNQKAAVSITNASGNVDYYGNLSDALSNWQDGTTLTLLDNFSLESCIEVSSYGVVLNLNGFSLTGPNGTGDVISNQGSLIINGPGTITGYHGISNTTNNSLTLNDVTIVAEGYGVQNFGATTLTGNTVIDSDLVALKYGGGSIDLSDMTDEAIMGWTIHSIKAQPHLDGIILPSSTGQKLYDKNGQALTELAANQIATILPVTEHVHTGRYIYTAAYNGTHLKLYACCDEVADAAENCSGGTADCQNRAVCQHCRARYGSVDLSNHVIANRYYYTADDATKTLHKNCVCQQSIASATLSVPMGSIYDGQPKEATFNISGNFTSSRTLTYNTEDGTAPTDAGTYIATLAVGTASVAAEYNISPAPLTLIDASIADVAYRQDGRYTFSVAVTFDGLVGNDILAHGTDYTAEVALTGTNTVGNNISATVTVSLVNPNYILSRNNTCSSTVNIAVSSIEHAEISVADGNVYTGTAIEPNITVALDGTTLIKGRDYTVSYINNVNAGTAAVTITGMGNYAGAAASSFVIAKAVPTMEDFTMRLPSDLVYDGETKSATVSVRSAVTGMGSITVKYSPASPINAGTYQVLLDAAEGTNFTSASNLEIGSFTIRQSNTQITAVPFLESTPNTVFTYGQTITVKGSVTAMGDSSTLRSMRMAVPAANQVALFYGDVQISEPATIDEHGTFELTCDTRKKQIKPSADPISLTVQYIGDQNTNMVSTAATLAITLHAKEVTVASVMAEDRLYDGSRNVAITAVTLDGILDADTLSVKTENLVGTVASENAGTYSVILLPELTLINHADSSFYTLKQPNQPVMTDVTIRKLHLTCESLPEHTTLAVYCVDAEAVKDQLPQKLTFIGEDNNIYTVDLTWKCERYNSTPQAENTFFWSVHVNPNFDVDTITGSILVTNADAKAVELIGTNASITYDGSTYDVEDMFTLDPNAGEAAYSISGGSGAGKLNGTTLTITRAGTIIIALKTTAVGQYAAGTATATLTISKGEPSFTAPTGLTATYGQTLADIPLGHGWAWKAPETQVGDAGDNAHIAIFTPEDTDLWNTREISLTVSVSKADVLLAGSAATFLDGTPTTVFTYGDVITVTASPVLPMSLSADYIPPAFNQMALFYGSTQISAPADMVNGVWTMTYHTTDQILPTGTSTFSVHYTGNDNVSNGCIDLVVTIQPAELTIAGVTAAGRPYKQGDLSIPVINMELAGKKLDSDDVFVDPDAFMASVESDQAGIYHHLTLPAKITLNGTAAQFYTIKGNITLPVSVEITKAEPIPSGNVKPSVDKDYTPGITLGELTPSLPETAFDVPGTVTWKASSDTSVTPGQPYDWIFTPTDTTNYKTVTGSLVIYSSAPPTSEPPVITPTPPTPTPEPPVVTPTPPSPTPEPPVVTPTPPSPTPEPPVVTPTPPSPTPEPPVVTPTPPSHTPEPPVITPTPPVSTPEPPVVTPTPPVNTPIPPFGTPDPIMLPTLIQPMEDQLVVISAGDTTLLSITAMNADSYQWYVDRNDGTGYRPINDATENQLILVVSQRDDGNTYLCRISNEDGTINSPVFALAVLPKVDPPLTGDNSNLMLWAALLLLSTAGLGLMRKYMCIRR